MLLRRCLVKLIPLPRTLPLSFFTQIGGRSIPVLFCSMAPNSLPLTPNRSHLIKGERILNSPIPRIIIAGGRFVCRNHRCWPTLLILLFIISSPFPLCAASVHPPPPSLKSATRVDQLHIALLTSVSLVLLLALLFGMGFLLRFLRLKKNKDSNQVESINQAIDVSKGKFNAEESVKKYNWEEIKSMTENFAEVIGIGGFSNVYLAKLLHGSGEGAVKVHLSSDRLNQVFRQELDILLRLRHGNIVKLLGYCNDQDEGAMVFEYVPNGNLQEKLHERESESVLPWTRRTAIVFQLAQAIEYLHEKCTLQIVHGDIKASNILLDENLNCKLCDFGSAKMGFSSTVLPSSSGSYRTKPVMIGSPGYIDPHYLRTGIASKKKDIYSLGVIILELLTGKPAFLPEKGQQLTSVLAPILRNVPEYYDPKSEERLAELIDPRLAGEFNVGEARTMLTVAVRCLHQSPTFRLSSTEIVQTLEQEIPSVLFPASPHKNWH